MRYGIRKPTDKPQWMIDVEAKRKQSPDELLWLVWTHLAW
jgi:hypothetical protein